jgi:hypothetical protein
MYTYILTDELNSISGNLTQKEICKKCNKKWCLIPCRKIGSKQQKNSCLSLSETQPHFCTECVYNENTESEKSDDNDDEDDKTTLLSLKQPSSHTQPKNKTITDSKNQNKTQTTKSFVINTTTLEKAINSNHQIKTNFNEDKSASSMLQQKVSPIGKRKIDNQISDISIEKVVFKLPKFDRNNNNKSLSRCYKERNNVTGYAPSIPTNKVTKITNLIKNHFNINTTNIVKSKFLTMNEAIEHFGRKFGYLSNNQQRFFSFYLPQYLPKLYNHHDKDTCNLHLLHTSIQTLYNESWLNDDIIDFVLQSLNIFIYYNTDQQEIPTVIFGSTQDCTKVVPNKSAFSKIYEYLNTNFSNDQKYQTLKSDSIELMKYWYCEDSKNYLSKILDVYKKKSKCITKYANVVNIENNHWIYIEVNLDHSIEKARFGTIKCIDSIGNSDTISSSGNSTKSHIVRFFSKFFGLYKKETLGYTLSDKDFDLKETETYTSSITASANASDNHQKELNKYSPSYLQEIFETNTVLQTDGYNCGLHALLECISVVVGEPKMHNIALEDQTKYINDQRLNIMSLVSTIYDIYNKEDYAKYSDQLFLNTSDKYTNGSLIKWQHIHKLFDNGELKYSLLENVNANLIFDNYTLTIRPW